jgi:hypothetical protein
MKTLSLALVVAVASCGGTKPAGPVSGTAEAGASIAPLDTLLAHLESMRPYVVAKGSGAECAAYTGDASAVIAKLAASTPEANAARASSSPDSLAQWQKAHATAIEKLIADVAVPVRNVTGCEPMDKDETWKKVSFGIVAVAQPAQPPAPVVKRRALMSELIATAPSVKTAADCTKLKADMMAKIGPITQEAEAMSPIEKFIDDKVWEEEDESRMKAEPAIVKVSELCGF